MYSVRINTALLVVTIVSFAAFAYITCTTTPRYTFHPQKFDDMSLGHFLTWANSKNLT